VWDGRKKKELYVKGRKGGMGGRGDIHEKKDHYERKYSKGRRKERIYI
jgi:hypothetical protein